MASYIFVDSNGKEVNREIKGRGPTRSDAVKKEDGNYYITVAPQSKPAPESKPTPVNSVLEKPKPVAVIPEKKPEVVSPQPVVNSGVVYHTKKIKASVSIDLRDMIKKCHTSFNIVEDDKVINIVRPDILAETLGIPEFHCHYAAFARFMINKAEKSLSVWILRSEGSPDIHIENAFSSVEL